VPGPGDLYLLKHVLHDWPDESARVILENIARAMSPEGSLLLIEAVLDPGDDTRRPCALRDLEQMVWTGGSLRTRGLFESLLQWVGLGFVGVTGTPLADLRLLEARRSA
jgi:hypothetical protein